MVQIVMVIMMTVVMLMMAKMLVITIVTVVKGRAGKLGKVDGGWVGRREGGRDAGFWAGLVGWCAWLRLLHSSHSLTGWPSLRSQVCLHGSAPDSLAHLLSGLLFVPSADTPLSHALSFLLPGFRHCTDKTEKRNKNNK